MQRPLKYLLLPVTIAFAVHAQVPRPAFEVASVKPAVRNPAGGRGSPGASDPTQITYAGIPLQFILLRAFDVMSYQIAGPEWLSNEQYDLRAKIPADASREQIPAMFQTLLAERFGMKFHHETRDLPAYELVVAKGGLKMKESSGTADLPPEQKSQGDGKPPLLVTTKDKDGLVQLPAGRKGAFVVGIGGGRMRFSARMQSADEIAKLLVGRAGRPVVNKTGLLGIYDFNLDFSTTNALAPGPEPSSGSPLPEAKDDAPPFLMAVESLGLRLVAVKIPVDVVVIDHIEKVPTEN